MLGGLRAGLVLFVCEVGQVLLWGCVSASSCMLGSAWVGMVSSSLVASTGSLVSVPLLWVRAFWLVGFCVVLVYLGVLEGSRIPADLPECESELVSGYCTELAGLG